MHDDRVLVERRLDRVLTQRIRPAVHGDRVPLDLEVWHVPGEPVPVADALGAAFVPFKVGDRWGRPWGTSWFRATGEVPASWAGRRVEAVFDLGWISDWPGGQAEGLVHDAEGRPIKGINPRNQEVAIAGPGPVRLLVEAASNPDILHNGFVPTPLGDLATAGQEPLYTMARAELAVLDEEVWHLLHDLDVLRELMLELAVTDPRRHEILRALERSLDALSLDDVSGTAAAARAEVAGVLARPAHASAHTISAVGHAHIDSAWLWPLRETVRKTARTFANVTALAADYPEFIFACSQAQQYAWVKEHSPEVFRRIQAAVKAGQWEPVGGMWVEADGNLPGGEALARQLVHGKRLFLDEFGVDCRGVWLPDSFGYTAAYPQLARLAGMDWFLTQKISWNQTNKFPHHTFWWEGIDGSRIFTHFPPADTYNSDMTGGELAHAVRNYQDKGGGTRSLLPFGFGDGGGGPTREMLEKARRLRDLEGSPKVIIETPDEFFDAARAEYPNAPVWSGELYLELHRGTFTSQARTKAGNRRSEHMLRTAEFVATTAAVRAGSPYPYERLDRLWKTVLLHQFHDILPGSSIAWVHREAEATYERVLAELAEIVAAATAAVAGTGDATWVLNAGPLPRTEVVGDRLVQVGPSYLGPLVAAETDPDPVRAEDRTLDNGLVRVVLDDDGLITSITDLVAGREVLAAGQRGNLLRLHADLPNEWDAWDVDRHYRHQYTDLTEAESVKLVEAGPLTGAIRVERAFGASRITQTIRVRAGSKRIDIETEVDWHEAEKMLKAGFPLDVHADRTAAEIQFGHVHRPTHTNTSWEAARFEVYGHRWVHAGEHGYGVALINDATYGHDATRDEDGATVVRLSLLRAPRCPDPQADQGLHRMTYAILPGATVADAIAEGYALNLPLRLHPGGAAEPAVPLVESSGVVIEAVKLADDRSGDVILRVYEPLGGRAHARIRPSFPVAAVEVVDLLERPLAGDDPAPEPDGSIPLEVRPFQVLTLRLRRA
ncbi:alpha-mannosidase [Actinoplanes subtropicus]|uniref:alpha-mannosidase n=1 Tax=Actinoplanes subtropicus TaxID=543632 RepID=UPI0004C372F5|nr:glycoside hydrolase family 38 C-terminal domain-containing protein [Actinoplanes subtropicus]